MSQTSSLRAARCRRVHAAAHDCLQTRYLRRPAGLWGPGHALLATVAAGACVLALAAPATAANIAWVSFHPADGTPSAAAADAGFTTASDIGYTQLLAANGHNVTRIVTMAPTAAATPANYISDLNQFDLVIISRAVDSGHYSAANRAAWHSIGVPVISMGGYANRGGTDGSTRLHFMTGDPTSIPDTNTETAVCPCPVTLTATQPGHPIFAGVGLDGSNNMEFATDVDLPFDPFTLQRGISVVTNPPDNGTVLATVGAANNAAAVGGLLVGYWEPGTLLGAGTPNPAVLAGHRMVFLSGSREWDVTSQGAGIFDLTSAGEQLFLNAVDYMAALGPVLRGDVNGDGVVDVNDYNIIRDNFNLTGAARSDGDLDGDGIVSFSDFRIWKSHRTDLSGAGAVLGGEAAVPEPASALLALLGAALAAVVIRGRRR